MDKTLTIIWYCKIYIFVYYFLGKAGQQTRILWGMVLVFIFCQAFTIVADIYELMCTIFPDEGESTFCTSNIHIENFIDVAHFMIAVNSSVNFIFYMVNIKEFREAFIKVSLLVTFWWNCVIV